MKKFFMFLLLCLFVMPVASNAQQYKEERVYYTVKKGDYLKGIADMYGTTVPELHKLNPKIKDVNKIYPGTRVLFIDRKGVEARKRAAAAGNNDQLAQQRAQAERDARLAAEQREMQEKRLAEEQRKLDEERAAKERAEQERKMAEERKKLEEERERMRKAQAQQAKEVPAEPSDRRPMYVAVRGFGMLATDINTMEIAPFGYGGAFDYNAQINDWFGITFSIDAGYISGNNKGVDAKSVNIGARAFFVFQPTISLQSSGLQPYVGVGPSYTYSMQDVYQSATSNCNIGKHRIGIAATAGLNYVYKDFIFGIDLEYNFVQPQSTDDMIIHMDMASGFTGGLRFGYRF